MTPKKPRYAVRSRVEFLHALGIDAVAHNVVDNRDRKFLARCADEAAAKRIADLLNAFGK
jgi:hypothetical protein